MSILNELKDNFQKGNTLNKVIFINGGIFVLFNLVIVTCSLFNIPAPDIFGWFMFPADLGEFLLKPWSLISYMFLHEGLWHLLINLIWLYFGGTLFLQYFDGKKFLSVYLLGGFVGAAFYMLAYNLFPIFAAQVATSSALGASASVLAILVAIATYIPNYSVRLMLIGSVKLKYIAMFAVVIDILSLTGGNAGGHFAHLGGAAFGFYFSTMWLKGKDITERLDNLLESIENTFKGKKKAKMKVKYSAKNKKPTDKYDYATKKKFEQDEIDKILEKISKSGYDSLSKEEKEKLFKMSKN